jgi:hypothetical protein
VRDSDTMRKDGYDRVMIWRGLREGVEVKLKEVKSK